MTKSRKKKNYKLRRRVKRTIAALIMIMAVVVAAIPVENLGTTQAAGGDWSYTETSDKVNFTAFDESRYSKQDLVTQTLTDDLLTDSVVVWAESYASASNAIIKGYKGTDTKLDISDKMYYNYAYFEKSKVISWCEAIQKQNQTQPSIDNEKLTVSFNLSGGKTTFTNPNNPSDKIEIPAKYAVDTPVFAHTGLQSGTIEGFETDNSTSFTYDDIKQIFNDFQTYENELITYNDNIQNLLNKGNNIVNASNWDDAAWTAFKDEVNTFANTYSPSGTYEKKIDSTVDFDNYIQFYLKSFCNRVKYTVKTNTSEKVPLKLFELTERTKHDDTGDRYVYVAKCTNLENLDATYKKYVDDNNYLVDGYVYINGVGTNAFTNAGTTTVTEIKLPDTIVGIADSAFENSGLRRIDFNPKVCKQIGNRAFYGCDISEINLTNDNLDGVSLIEKIGNNAFYGTRLTNVNFPASLTLVGKGSFAETPLSSVDFSKVSKDLIIDEHAFYNCTGLTTINFPTSGTSAQTVKINKAAFSVPENSGTDALKEFIFPNNIKDVNDIGDYILAGRANLEHVTFPSYMLGQIPEHTLAGCSNLAIVTLGKISEKDSEGQNIKISSGSTDSVLFNDILNTSFYVEGPGFTATGNKTDCRTQTLKCKAAVGTLDEFYVPYKFIEKGKEMMERKQESDSGSNFTAIIDDLDDSNKTARLSKFEFETIPSSGTKATIEVPSDVGGYAITSLGEGCFEKVIPYMSELIISDGTINRIDDGAIKGADILEKVTIGNSVRTIGTDAFADCPMLTSVTFNEPAGINEDDWVSAMDSIADGAFKTNSTSLVFHGAIHDGYAPFEYAMSAENAGFSSSQAGKNICYQTNAPESLSVIRDNATGLSTLIDYPNMKNISQDVVSAFTAYKDGTTLTEDQVALINDTLNIVVPDGVESIDVKEYFSNENNQKNKEYFDSALISIYLDESDDITAGLFSCKLEDNNGKGLTMEGIPTSTTMLENVSPDINAATDGNLKLKDGGYTEYVTKGNDHLTSIEIGNDVSGMPEQYAFDSCENLTYVKLGEQVSDIGKLPFRGCKSLTTLDGNSNYSAANGILYGTSTEGGSFDTIVECFEARGQKNTEISGSVIKVANDPGLAEVTKICEEAFANCTNLSEIDFTGSKITGIPKNCFKGDDSLSLITLPEEVGFVEEGAFTDMSATNRVTLWIYDPNCYIDSKAVSSTTEYLVHGYKYTDSSNTRKSAVYNFCEAHSNVEFAEIVPGYTVTFRNYDGKIIDQITGITDPSQRITPPDMTEFLKTNPYDGHIFVDWLWTDSTGADHIGTEAYSNIAEDRDVYATYKLDPGEYVFTGEDVDIEIVNGTLNGNGTMNDKKTTITIASGKDIYITADTIKDKTFSYWSVSDDLDIWVNNLHDKQTTFTVPNPPTSGKITITANFLNTPGSGGGSGSGEGGGTGGGGTGGGGSSTDTTTKYKVTVNYGTGSGEYKAGDTVNISALAPDTSTKVFSKWTSATSGVGFANATSATTSFIMPASDVTVTANYKTRSSDDDSDSDRGSSSSSRPGSSSTTNTVSNRPSSSTSTTGTTGTVTNTTNGNTTGNNNNNNGNKLYITKNGVSNKDVGSVSVDGSSDNFIVKISDSDEATAAVKEALTNKYGSLDGLAYFPMDISLYDSTGQNKITDTYGLNITVTMPIPDVLIQYGGNARVAAADNGNLQQLTPKFTTIDGIACISFVPPHFSPYVIYVDTNNLVAGQTLDSTPSTGDPIHPKWFAAIGMACISIILFATSDGHKRRKYKAA